MSQPRQLTRTCISCGQTKPLSAFLQLSGPQGATYGSICSTCRKTQSAAGDKKPEKEIEEHTTDTTGLKIDAKTKLQMEKDKKSHLEQVSANNQQEKKKREEISEEKLAKTDEIEKKEKTKRESLFDSKQQSFIGSLGKKTETIRQALITQKTREDTIFAKNVQEVHQEKLEKTKEFGNKEEQKKSAIDFTHGMQPGIRYNSGTFKQFEKFLGKGSALGQTLERAFGNQDAPAEKKETSENQDKPTPKRR